jgi:thiol:disulfide interchange protein
MIRTRRAFGFLAAALGILLGLPGLWAQPGPQALSVSAPPFQADPVRASLRLSSDAISPGGSVDAILVLEHDPLWHSYGENPGRTGLPTRIDWQLPDGLSAGPIRWPAPTTFSSGGIVASGYSGRVELRTRISASKELAPGSSLSLGAKVSWLACKESCIPGEASFALSLGVAKSSPFSLQAFLLALGGAFLGGILLNLMPCVLPVLALKFDAFIRQGALSQKRSIGRGLAYSGGIVISFLILAGILLALKAGGSRLGWGFQFQNPGFIAAMALFFTAFALNMLGVFEIGAGGAALAEKGIVGSGALRSFLLGVFATLAATPCAAPFMGAAIGYALGSGPMESLGVFALLGLGMALPVLLLSAFPRLAALLPKPGRWMETLQRLLGFILLGTVIWLLSLLSAFGGNGAPIRVLAAMLGAAISAWIWGRWGRASASRRSRRVSGALALSLFAASLGYAVLTSRNVPATASSAPPAAASNGASAETGNEAGVPPLKPIDDEAGLTWEVFSEAAVRQAREAGQPVFIDFRADWCLSCILNEAGVLKDDRVVSEFGRLGLRAFRADWTKSDPEIGKALASYGRRSVPLYVVYLPGRTEPFILPEILTQGAVLTAIGSISP